MALTASAQSALPSWDETIVPALRKRLESESRTLSKRISAASVVSYEELHNGTPKFSSTGDATVRERTHGPSYSVQLHKGTAIPRPSFQKSRTSEGGSRPDLSRLNGSANGKSSPLSLSSKPPSFQRPRTKSQPFPVDLPIAQNVKVNGSGTGSRNVSSPNILQDSAQPLSPTNTRSPEMKPTRIPKAPVFRGDRSGSISSHGHAPIVGHPPTSPVSPISPTMGNGYGYPPPNGAQTSQEVWDSSHPRLTRPLASEQPNHSTGPRLRRQASEHSNFSTGPRLRRKASEGSNYSAGPRRNGSEILSDKTQVISGTWSSNMSQQSPSHTELEDEPPRRSMESEERPFEHWYRGEVSRNGGVGELRVGKRMEMLEIANYGHKLRKAAASDQRQIAPELKEFPRRRKRADSYGEMSGRESFHMDEDKIGVNEEGYLVDESPLTDLDGSADDHEAYAYASYLRDGFSMPPPVESSERREEPNDHRDRDRSVTPTGLKHRGAPLRQGSAPPTRIPGPSSFQPRQSSEPARISDTTSKVRGASEPPPSSSSSASHPNLNQQRLPSTTSQPQGTLQPPQSSTQKRRAKSPAASSSNASKKAKMNKNLAKIRNERDRRSVAEYPAPKGDGDDIMYAIPSWSEPVPGDGDWDDVVLPVVARKRGLDGHYEHTGGGPRMKRPSNESTAPAPGTFAFDHSKYRPPLEDEEIPLDEFGRHGSSEDRRHKAAIQDDRPEGRSSSFPQPPAVKSKDERIAEIVAQVDLENGQAVKAEKGKKGAALDEDAGCCKCVIM